MRRFKISLFLFSGVLFFGFIFAQYFIPQNREVFIFILGLSLFLWVGFVTFWFRPLERIVASVIPYNQGKLPRLNVENWERKNMFTQLALCLNSLSERVHMHIQHAQEKDKEMEGILDSLNEGVIGFNIRSKVIFVNQVACKMLGVSRVAMIGRSLHSLESLDGFLQKCHEIVLQALQTSESIIERWTSNGAYFDLVASPLIHQEGAILVIQDKTSDYKVLEVGKNFIANASHELRTPITIVRGFAEMLQNVSQLSPQTMVDITNKIVRTCDRLDKLVKSLLTIADLEHFSESRFRICNLASLFESCKHLLLTAYPEVHLIIADIEEVSVLGDFDLLDLAIMNLLENAVKYSPPPAHIEIAVRVIDSVVYISFQDCGIGIPDADLPHIFDRFYTVDKARSRKSGGAGLGLSLVKTIIEKHCGTIAVQSVLGQGTTFTIVLPIFKM
jgi:two-component system phosphate regulon sensor histidine kinase PhoR